MIDRWLALLCQLLPGVARAVVVRRDGSLTSQWPRQGAEVAALVTFARSAGKGDGADYQMLPDGLTAVAMPLHNRQVHVGTLALEMPLKLEQRGSTELLLRWSQAWLELLSDNNREKTSGLEMLLYALEQGSRFANLPDNCSALATALADKLSLSEVLVCLPHKGRVRVVGVSHAPSFDRRSEMFTLLENYLATAPSVDGPHDHNEYQRWLSTRQPRLAFSLVPLPPEGYLVLLFHADKAPGNVARAQCKQAARLLAPLYQNQNQLRQGLLWRWCKAIENHYNNASLKKKGLLFAGALLLLTAFLCLPGQQRVTAQATLEGKIQRAIVAPEDGYLLEADVKAGEVIRQGQQLAQLDGKSIQLEIQRWVGEKQEYERQYNRELTALNPVEMRIAKAKLAQAEAQLNLYRERLQRVRITAPIDGVIIKGDLSRAIGSPLQRGQVLYEIAPLDAFKLVIQVPEQSIRFLTVGQSGRLLLSAMPHSDIAFKITSVASVYSDDQRDILYRVEAEITDTAAQNLRPGMSGYAKIDAGKKTYGWLIGHRLWDWLALRLWRV